MHTIEPLEHRIAPAAIFTYTEPDGDVVTVKTSIGNGAGLFLLATFDSAGAAKQLRRLDLDTQAAMFEGADLSITVTKRGAQGDGLAKVGAIDATGMDLGNVTVRGDLGQIDAGNAIRNGPAVKSLSVHSMGAYGLDSQGGAGDLASTFVGTVGKLTVKTSLNLVQLSVIGAGSMLGPAKIGGSLNIANIVVAGNIPSIAVGQDVRGSQSRIHSTGGNIGTVKIGGDLVGDTAAYSGAIVTDAGNIGAVKIGGSIFGGNLTAGVGPCGAVYSSGRIGSVSVGGDIVVHPLIDSGDAPSSVTGIRAGLDIGSVTVRGEIRGTLSEKVEIVAFKNPDPATAVAIRSVTIGGSVGLLNLGAGYPLGVFPGSMTGSSPDVQIGRISIGGDWVGSSVFCGVSAPNVAVGLGAETLLPGGQAAIVARIGSIVIKGAVNGSTNAAQATAFLAEDIGSFSVNGAKLALKPLGAAKDRFLIGGSGNVRVYEV